MKRRTNWPRAFLEGVVVSIVIGFVAASGRWAQNRVNAFIHAVERIAAALEKK